jgi:subtilase family serine protease
MFFAKFYSNSDLSKFLALSGLPDASIPDINVYGDLANNQSHPGGEAQLDVEYIMVCAHKIST